MCKHIHPRTQTHTRACAHTYITHTQTNTYAHAHACAQTYLHTHARTHTHPNTRTHTQTHTNKHKHTLELYSLYLKRAPSLLLAQSITHTCAHAHARAHTRIYTHARTDSRTTTAQAFAASRCVQTHTQRSEHRWASSATKQQSCKQRSPVARFPGSFALAKHGCLRQALRCRAGDDENAPDSESQLTAGSALKMYVHGENEGGGGGGARGKRRAFSPGAAARHSQSARVHTEFLSISVFFFCPTSGRRPGVSLVFCPNHCPRQSMGGAREESGSLATSCTIYQNAL